MTVVTISDKHIEIKGHSNYAPINNDIVCASISTAVFFLIDSSNSEYINKDGYIKIERKGINKTTLETFISYVRQLSKQYNEYVEVRS